MTYNSLLTQLDNQRTQPWVDYQFNMGGLTDIDSVIKTLRKIGVKVTGMPKINVQNIVAFFIFKCHSFIDESL